MSIQTKLWKVENERLVQMTSATLPSEKSLETWLEQNPSLLGEQLLIVGRQVHTAFGGVIDLLAIDAAGLPVIIELKREMTPREATAQLLDYGSWLSTITAAELEELTDDGSDMSLANRFKQRFGNEIPDVDTRMHRLLLVAPNLDDASERIIQYLSSVYKMNINSVSFNVFGDDSNRILARSWLIEPSELARITDVSEAHGWVWTGIWYVNVGQQPEAYEGGVNRSWADCVKYQMISAGQGRKWSLQLEKLKVGETLFAYLNRRGYVGRGVVRSLAVKSSQFIPPGFDRPISELPLEGNAISMNADDDELSDYVVGVDWKGTRNANTAEHFKGIFAKQFVVCKLSDPKTLEFLESKFGKTNPS
jgi:hypothetical protein